MRTIHVNLKQNGYKICVGQDILSRLGRYLAGQKNLSLPRHAVVVTNRKVDRLHGAKLRRGLKTGGFTDQTFYVPDAESSKSADVVMPLIDRIARHDAGRNVFVVAFGGGVIGDLAGFIAAVYKRGVPYVQVPTTLLAQIDSAIGGKVAIDLPTGKNLAGAFYQPKLVWSDTALLATLPLRQIRNGLAEAIKYGAIRDRKLFDYIERNAAGLLARKKAVLRHVVERCSRIKAEVVQDDEKETKGIRTILNFGHTVGHGIEAATGYHLPHGEAIAVGMRVAAEISSGQRTCSPQCVADLNRVLDAVGLPKKMPAVPLSKVLEAMRYDKKNVDGRNRFVLLSRIGKVCVKTDVPEQSVRATLRKFV